MTIFDLIRQKVEIYDVVARRVNLRRLGSYWKGSCPFHFETDASFTISPDKKIFYCFGCHEGGDAVAFIAKIENVSQVEAAEIIIKDFSIAIPAEVVISQEHGFEAKQETDLLKKACLVFANWTNKQLLSSNQALQYFSSRGISAASIERFNLGFFPLPELENINNLLGFAASQGILAKNLIDAGILATQHQTLWSPFSGRIIFPIRESDGKTVGFGGRIFFPNDLRPKYYNSRETSIFHKGSLLFGMDLAKQATRKNKSGFLVEGYMDCVAMSQYGLEETFAVLGTACTLAHLKTLSRFLQTLYVMYDADRAGQAAVLKLAKNCWDVEIDLKVIVLPAGQDPASFIQNNGDVRNLINSALGIFEFFLQKTNEKFVGAPLSQKIELTREVAKTICQLEDFVKRDLLLLEVARVFQVPFASLKKSLIETQKHSNNNVIADSAEVDKSDNKKNGLDYDDSSVNKLSQQIIFMYFVAAKNSVAGFDLTEQIEQSLQGEARKILSIWKNFCSGAQNTDKFNIFLNNLDEGDRTKVLKGMLVAEQNLDRSLFLSLVQELKKRMFKQLILHARQDTSRAILGGQECSADVLKKICEFSKKVRARG